jgi:hypothetical protein
MRLLRLEGYSGGGEKTPADPFAHQILNYRICSNSFSIWSAVVMIEELAWKAR